jgi:uncharacterized protein (TIGR00297 family)
VTEALVAALILNGVLALLAYSARAVSFSGAAAGLIVGSATYVAGGPSAWFLLGWFFISSSVLGKIADRIAPPTRAFHGRGSRRVAIQVLANGGAAAAAFVAFAATGSPAFAVAGAAAFAEAAADTWAGETGRFSKHPPVSAATFKPVERGASGGITTLGSLGGVLGALSVGIFAAVLSAAAGTEVTRAAETGLIVTGAGVLGAALDSLLGATVQAVYIDPGGSAMEEPGAGATLVRGLPFVTNDAVNAAGTLFAAAAAYVLG